MKLYHIITLIILLTAIFSYINQRFIKLPQTIGIMALSLISSIILVIFGTHIPYVKEYATIIISSIDFHKLLMDVLLGFLLFAGAYHIDESSLKKQRLSVITLA